MAGGVIYLGEIRESVQMQKRKLALKMASAKLKGIFRVAISFCLLLVLCLPPAAKILQPLGLEQAEAASGTLLYAPVPKGGGNSLLITGRRANFDFSGGFIKIDWVVGRTALASILTLLPFAMGPKARLHHRADRSAISIRAPPRQRGCFPEIF